MTNTDWAVIVVGGAVVCAALIAAFIARHAMTHHFEETSIWPPKTYEEDDGSDTD